MLMRHTTSTYIKLACSICYRLVILHVRLAEYFLYSTAYVWGLFVTFVAEEEDEPEDRHICLLCSHYFID